MLEREEIIDYIAKQWGKQIYGLNFNNPIYFIISFYFDDKIIEQLTTSNKNYIRLARNFILVPEIYNSIPSPYKYMIGNKLMISTGLIDKDINNILSNEVRLQAHRMLRYIEKNMVESFKERLESFKGAV